MASPVQVVSNFEASSTTCVVTLASTGAGNTIVAVAYAQNAITAVETGTETAGWAARQTTSGADAGTITIWSQPGTEGGDTSVTVTQAAAGQIAVYVFELPGICTYDTGNTGLGNGAGTTWTSGSTGTTAHASEFWIGCMGGFNDAGTNPTAISGPASPWTNEAVVHAETGVFLISGWRETTTTGTALYNGTTTGVTAGNFFYGAAVAAFAEGGSPAGATTSGGLAVLPGEIFAFTPGPVTASGRLAAITPAITGTATVSNPPSGTNPSWDPAGGNAVGGAGYELTFNDNFTSINTDVWTLGWQATTGISGPINAATDPGVDGEASAYDSANCTISGGSVLSMAMVHTNVVSGGVTYPWSGACMTTNPTTLGTGLGFQQTGGCFEARINLPVSGGVLANWPAWWLDGQTWPADGEIDIMEGLGGNAQWHSWSTPNDPGVGSSAPGESPSASNYGGWHTYGVSWDASAGQMDYYYDGVLVGSIASGVADSPNYLILDYTTGWFSGPSVAGDMLVDWIRVWEQPTTPAPPQGILQLADNFPSTADLYSKWTGEGLTVSANQVAIQCDPDYDGFLQSGTIYNFTNGTFSAEVTNPTGTIETGMILSNLAQDGGATFTDSVSWGYDGTNLVASITQSAAATTVATLTYSATTHKWWRMSETGGTGISWYTSPNGTAWTLQGSHAHTMVTSNLFAEFYTGNDGAGTLSTFIAAVNGGSAPATPVTSAGGLGALAAAAGGAATYTAPAGADVTAGGLAVAPAVFAGTVTVIPPLTTSSGRLTGQPLALQGVAPNIVGGTEVWTNTPTGTVTAGGQDAPIAGTTEVWTVNVTRAFPAAHQTGTPTMFYATDPADTTDEIFQVSTCPGGLGSQTWIVTRGANSSVPVTHSPGFVVTQVVTQASLEALQASAAPPGTPTAGDVAVATGVGSATAWSGVPLTGWYNVRGYGATGNGVTDDTDAILAAITACETAGQGVVYLPAGNYLVSSTITVAQSGIYLVGDGLWATTITFTGTGDALRWYDTSSYTARTVHGGGPLGLSVSIGGAGSGSCALHAGDILRFQFAITVEGSGSSGSIGVHLDNQTYWMEQAEGVAYVDSCTQDVVFDCSGADTSAGSYDRGDFTFYLSHKTFTGGPVTFQNGAYMVGGRLRLYGNINSSASTFTEAVLTLTGSAPAGHPSSISSLAQCQLDFNLESDEALAHTFQTINYGSTANTITACYGAVSFGAGNQFTASNVTSVSTQFAFIGPVVGDTTLNESQFPGRMSVSSQAFFFSSLYIAEISSTPSTPSGGGVMYGDSAGNLHYLGPGGGNTTLARTNGAATPVSYTPADPTGTTGTALTMMGLGSACTFTPKGSGNVQAVITAAVRATGTAEPVTSAGRYGTGTAPSNGGTAAGTKFGVGNDTDYFTTSTSSAESTPVTFQQILSLTPGTAYWFDLAVATTNVAGTATPVNITASFVELP